MCTTHQYAQHRVPTSIPFLWYCVLDAFTPPTICSFFLFFIFYFGVLPFQLFHNISPPVLADIMLFRQTCILFTHCERAVKKDRSLHFVQKHRNMNFFFCFCYKLVGYFVGHSRGHLVANSSHESILHPLKTVKPQVLFAFFLVLKIKTPHWDRNDQLKSFGHVLCVVAGCETGQVLFL